ncbi:hypothetical protein GS429_08355 [Natronorubrum sp. JWXQ-INN-674]|uniref:Uncharacterized protein n=1 Tax=Natronorubrum halalkaliphilum TaxID=2691917 RepID=A0A6B0VJR8_9EURY|nr:hypothetical protein [Natronorubrum halalkaliphilum]MXV62071.1 hypothetical protein [Natronorubrum halalkaliphilum]
MTTHRWTSSTRLKRHDTGEEIAPGETFEPTDSELRAYGNQIERVEDDIVQEAETADEFEEILEDTDGVEVTDDGITPEPDGVAFDEDAWFDDHDGYQDRVETVESGVVDDVLEEIKDVERSEKVIEAAKARRDDPEDNED